MREITTKGTICLDDSYGLTYRLATIEYTEREDESYTYVIFPNYSVIDLLDSSLFQGIPGLDLELRLDRYVRDNTTPVFVSERSPQKNRENLVECLDECNMDYLNPLEWLIRTNSRYSGDPLYVCQYEEPHTVHVGSIGTLGNRSSHICRKLLENICTGNDIESAEITVTNENRSSIYRMLMVLYTKDKAHLDRARRDGIRKGAAQGNYRGRAKTEIDPLKLAEITEAYRANEISGNEAAERLGISRSTFLRRIK